MSSDYINDPTPLNAGDDAVWSTDPGQARGEADEASLREALIARFGETAGSIPCPKELRPGHWVAWYHREGEARPVLWTDR